MNPTECKFCGFTENLTEICAVCGNINETENQPVTPQIEPPVPQTFHNIPRSSYQNTYQRPPVRVSKCLNCGAEIPAFRHLCGVCEPPEQKKSGFGFLKLAIIVVPLAMALLCTIWLSGYFLEDAVGKTVRDFEKVTGINKKLQFDNYKLTGTGTITVKQNVPKERENYLRPDTELAFEMVFADKERFYVHFYREANDPTAGKKTVYQAGSNGYRHWQSVLAWSNLGVNQAYRHNVRDTEGFPNILHKNILLGLTDIKSAEKTTASECAAITPEAARLVMSPKMYTIEGEKHNVYPCDLMFLSVQDNKGYSSAMGFDPQTGVLLTERGYATLEDKSVWMEINYGAYKKFSLGMKSGSPTEKRIVLLPTAMHIVVVAENTQAATIRLNIKAVETNASFDPLEFEKPLL